MNPLDEFWDMFGIKKPSTEAPKRKFRYRIFSDGSGEYWQWWAEIPDMSIKISSTRSYLSRDLALEHMTKIMKELKWELRP